MVLDLQFAAYGQTEGKKLPDPQDLFPRKRYQTAMKERSTRTSMMNRMRHSTWRRQENFNKQLQVFLNRDRFQQNATWQAEYDRLAAIPMGSATQDTMDRLQDLREVIVTRVDPKSQLLSKTH
tara:strand:- start:373 stop:741 length:369 start_codon:yes stop_codon:yes gene_type:complete